MRKKLVIKPAVDVAAILGEQPKKAACKPLATGNMCVICLKKIPADRIDALQMLGSPRTQWTHTACSQTTKIKGIYMGEVGTSKLQLCDKIYNDSVRTVFKKSDCEEDPDDDKD